MNKILAIKGPKIRLLCFSVRSAQTLILRMTTAIFAKMLKNLWQSGIFCTDYSRFPNILAEDCITKRQQMKKEPSTQPYKTVNVARNM
jgi:hypothetical protein